ncbi:MAG: proline dehydrogenase family protein [Parcubacteria group bacterium]|nr:proline dehydrogenase family protein [Parcubacteria group bacterium]
MEIHEADAYLRAQKGAEVDRAFFENRIRAECSRYSLVALLLSAASRDARLQKGILRFVSVLPTLDGAEDEYEHFRQYVSPYAGALPAPLALGARLLETPLFRGAGMKIVSWLIRKKIAPRFIVQNEHSLRRATRRYRKIGAETNIDFLGEDVVSIEEADEYLSSYLAAMKRYGGKEKPFHVAVKFSALYPFFTPENYRESTRTVGECFKEILRVAERTNSFVTVDAEQHARQGMVLDIFCETLSSKEFSTMAQVKIALQAYKRNAMATAERLVVFARERGTPFYIRLVKGAYLETERALAEQKGWPSPVWGKKRETDEGFDKIAAYLLRQWGSVFVSPATHNPANILFAGHLAREYGIADDPRFCFEVLHGLGEPILRALHEDGWRTLVYVPYLKKGNLLDGMGYFARRLEENTSNQNFLASLIKPIGGRDDND